MIRIIVADDHPVVRAGIKDILAEDAALEVVDEAGSGYELLRKLREGDFDVIVLDISMPGIDGLDTLQRIRTEKPGARVLILTIHPEARYAVRCLRMGADGYLTKGSAPDELINAIKRISQGRKYISLSLAEELTYELDPDSGKLPHQSLSDREYQVMLMIASGKPLKEIAAELSLSVKTVSTYRSRVLEKMKLSNNSQLILYAIRNQLID
jgi:two-component system, NarL family, invasion response regulator UvrY